MKKARTFSSLVILMRVKCTSFVLYCTAAKVGGPQVSCTKSQIRKFADLNNFLDWHFSDLQFADPLLWFLDFRLDWKIRFVRHATIKKWRKTQGPSCMLYLADSSVSSARHASDPWLGYKGLQFCGLWAIKVAGKKQIKPVYKGIWRHWSCPASPGKEKTKCGWISSRTHSDGPVSQTCLHRLLRRELTTRRNPRWLESTTQN